MRIRIFKIDSKAYQSQGHYERGKQNHNTFLQKCVLKLKMLFPD